MDPQFEGGSVRLFAPKRDVCNISARSDLEIATSALKAMYPLTGGPFFE